MSPESRALWGTLPGQRLMRLILEGRGDEARGKFRGLLDRMRPEPGIRDRRGPRQLSLFYSDPPLVEQPWPCAVERFEAGTIVPRTQ